MAVYDGKGNRVHCTFFERNPHILKGLLKETSPEDLEKAKKLVANLKIELNIDA